MVKVCKHGELYYTLEQVQMYGYGYVKEWVMELDVK